MNSDALLNQKLAGWIDGIDSVTYFTVEEAGEVGSQPVSLTAFHNGEIWFFCHQSTDQNGFVENQRILLSFTDVPGSRYVTVEGQTEAIYDTDGLREAWGTYFNDENLVLVRMSVRRADFRDAPASAIMESVNFVENEKTGGTFHPVLINLQ